MECNQFALVGLVMFLIRHPKVVFFSFSAECEVIGACAQVICTNSSDHFCRECESDNGPMQGQRAYTNLGTECQGID